MARRGYGTVVTGPAELAAAGLHLAADGQVATITLSRPERRNAMTPSMWLALADIGADLVPTRGGDSPGRSRVRVVVVRGAGPSFSSGIDLRLFSTEDAADGAVPRASDPEFDSAVASYQAGYLWLRDPAIVSVAVVQGHAIGAGFQLALACDLRVLADDAKLCMKEPALGLVPDLTGTKPLVEIVGLPRALEICLTSRVIEAREALELGLAELVVPVADLDDAVNDLCAALLAADPAAARATKELLVHAGQRSLPEQAAAERRAQRDLLLRRSAAG